MRWFDFTWLCPTQKHPKFPPGIIGRIFACLPSLVSRFPFRLIFLYFDGCLTGCQDWDPTGRLALVIQNHRQD